MSFVNREPAAIASAIIAVLQVLVLLGVLSATVDQLAAINTALVMVLGLVVRQSVTPVTPDA